MRNLKLRIDTSFGLSELDYINSSIHEIKIHNNLLNNLESEIKKMFCKKISEARRETNDESNICYRNDEILTGDLLYYSHMNLTDELGPDQSYLGIRGEYNSIEIYLNILKTMWKDYTPPDNIVNRRKVKRGINKTLIILFKIAFNKWKYNNLNSINNKLK